MNFFFLIRIRHWAHIHLVYTGQEDDDDGSENIVECKRICVYS